jgi:hypothetical protein
MQSRNDVLEFFTSLAFESIYARLVRQLESCVLLEICLPETDSGMGRSKVRIFSVHQPRNLCIVILNSSGFLKTYAIHTRSMSSRHYSVGRPAFYSSCSQELVQISIALRQS